MATILVDLVEDMVALTNKSYLESVKKARSEVKEGKVLGHREVFNLTKTKKMK